MPLSVFQPIDPTLTVVTTGLRGQPIYITNWPYGTEDGTTQRALRKNNFSGFLTERGPIVSAVNEITNPSFETNLDGWTITGTQATWTATRYLIPNLETEYWFEGNYAMKVVAELGATPWTGGGSININSPNWAVVPGQSWSVRCTYDLRNALAIHRFRIQWLNSSKQHVAYSPDQTWTTAGVTHREQDVQLAPAGAAYGRIQFVGEATAYATFTIYVDAAAAGQTGGAINYFDGSDTGAAWTGTAHASSSFLWT